MSKREKIIVAFATVFLLLVATAAVTVIDLGFQVKGVLALANGGTGQSSVPGSTGQLLYNNGGAIAAEDPIVSFNYVNLLTTAAATATASSASPVRLSKLSSFGTLYITFASITGSPVSCTLQLKNADSLGNLINDGSAISVTPSNGTTTVAVNPAVNLQSAAQLSATFACGTYPTGGTISVDFSQADSSGIFGSLPAGANTIGAVTQASGPWTDNLTQVAGHSVVEAISGVPKVGLTDSAGTGYIVDPCQGNAHSYISISQTTGTQLVAGTASKKIYVCSYHVVTATAQNLALVEGTGTVCASSIAGIKGFGGSTAATGQNFAASGGETYGDGLAAIGAEATNADNLCLLQSSTGQVSGGLSYVVQ